MRYLVHLTERTQATYEVEARNPQEAKSKAGDGDYVARDEWDTDVAVIHGVERRSSGRAGQRRGPGGDRGER